MANCNYWGTWNFTSPPPSKLRQDIDFELSEVGREIVRSITNAKHRIELLNEDRELRRNLADLW